MHGTTQYIVTQAALSCGRPSSELDNTIMGSALESKSHFKILALDGGGAKGVYSLAVLQELERATGRPIHKQFDLIYGTSTGAIIAALLGVATPAEECLQLYLRHVPQILSPLFARERSKRLRQMASDLFSEFSWDSLRLPTAFVATNWTDQRPIIFKSSQSAAHSLIASFVPGFGVSIEDAIAASCSATPCFLPCDLTPINASPLEARDGGFCANNPSLFALADALHAFQIPEAHLRLLSIGVGHYPVRRRLIYSIARMTPGFDLLEKTLAANAVTTEDLIKFLFPDLAIVRINEHFSSPDMETDFLECRPKKLQMLRARGRDSYAKYETEILELLNSHGKN